MYGLSAKHWKAIYQILDTQRAQLRWVKLFGSRARGEARRTSDVDLAFSGSAKARSLLSDAFEQSDLPYTIDLVDYEHQSNEKLRQRIDTEGRLLLQMGAKGG